MGYISAEKLCEFANNHSDNKVDANDIMRFPSEDVIVVRHGKWIKEWNFIGKKMNCSCCNYMFPFYAEDYCYCPNCGARMDGE